MVARWVAPSPESQILDYLVLDDEDTNITTCLAADGKGWVLSWTVKLTAKDDQLTLPDAEHVAIALRDGIHEALLRNFNPT